jgi:hypothetical protein
VGKNYVFISFHRKGDWTVNVLALDLASVSGWAVGEPGSTPQHGSKRFAAPGASHEAIFCKAMVWMELLLVMHEPGLIVWEAPMPTSFSRGMSNVNTTTLLKPTPLPARDTVARLIPLPYPNGRAWPPAPRAFWPLPETSRACILKEASNGKGFCVFLSRAAT